MATKKKKAPAKKKIVGKGGNYNVLAAVEGSTGAPPLAKVLKAATGKDVRSVVLRVDLDFANWVRDEARTSGRTVTSVTRDILSRLTQ